MEKIFSKTEVLKSFLDKTRKQHCLNFLSRLSHRQIAEARRSLSSVFTRLGVRTTELTEPWGYKSSCPVLAGVQVTMSHP